MTNKIKEGSKWRAGDKTFHVLSVVEINNNIWVHYIEDTKLSLNGDKLPGEKEYSCFAESFVSRFTPFENY
jgi:hypothetical protein